MHRNATLLLVVLAASSGLRAETMTAADLPALTAPAPDHRIAYGPDPLQFGHLRLPAAPAPHPVVVLIHGGCWLSDYDISHLGALEQAVADAGYAVWSLEYRRVGDDGGGWPATYRDIARGVDYLRVLAPSHELDLERVVASGHSAGGALALWAAARPRITPDSELFDVDPLPIGAVVALAPAADLEAIERRDSCGDVMNTLMGGTPAGQPARYRAASPMQLTPLGRPQLLVMGELDAYWTPTGQAYYYRALALGDTVEARLVPGAGHFELIAPGTAAWPAVRAAFEAAFARIGGTLSPRERLR